MSARRMSRAMRSISWGARPLAASAATMEPTLVPTYSSGTIPWVARTLRTPICARPLRPPPPSTSETRGPLYITTPAYTTPLLFSPCNFERPKGGFLSRNRPRPRNFPSRAALDSLYRVATGSVYNHALREVPAMRKGIAALAFIVCLAAAFGSYIVTQHPAAPIVLVFLGVYLLASLEVAAEWERAVVLRAG